MKYSIFIFVLQAKNSSTTNDAHYFNIIWDIFLNDIIMKPNSEPKYGE